MRERFIDFWTAEIWQKNVFVGLVVWHLSYDLGFYLKKAQLQF